MASSSLSSSASSFGAIRQSAMHAIDHLSPASSTTIGSLPTTTSHYHYRNDDDDADSVQQFRCRRSSVVVNKNTATTSSSSNDDLLLMKMMAAGDLMHHRSACDAVARSSKQPPTLTPVCSTHSTAHYHSFFATPKLCSCEQAGSRNAPPCDNYDHKMLLGEGKDISTFRCSLKSLLIRYAEQERESSVGTSNYYGDDDGCCRLNAVTEETLTEEPEEDQAETRGYRYAHLHHLSSGSGSYDGSEYVNTDIESLVDERIMLSAQEWRPFQAGPAAKNRENTLSAKLNPWKEARKMKIASKLRKEEAATNEWERKKIAKAQIEMMKLQVKLENKRAQAMQKMQREIRQTQEEAEKRKAKCRDAASKEIASVAKVVHRAPTTGKLSCCFFSSEERAVVEILQ